MALLVWQMIDGEEDLDEGLRALIYGILMIYCFIGVSIIAETFMCAIEAVTSRRKQVRLKTGRIITSRVWNDTVANLTLMALGSSAPEIMLAVIELFKNKMYAGELGPSTIVGSAAFNLHVIIAVCIFSIPSDEVRIVKQMNVFVITSVFSIFAYLWLVFILTAVSPDIVDIWEAAVTLLAFPALVWVSYLADIGKLDSCARPRIGKFLWVERSQVPDDVVIRACDILDSHDEETMTAVRRVLPDKPCFGSLENPSMQDMQELHDAIQEEKLRCKSRAVHRMESMKNFTGRDTRSPGAAVSASAADGSQGANLVQLEAESQSVSSDLSAKPVTVLRSGDLSSDVSVEYSVHLCIEGEEPSPQAGGSALGAAPARRTSTASHGSADASGQSSGGTPASRLSREVLRGRVELPKGQRRCDIVVQRPTATLGACQDFIVRLRSVEVDGKAQNAQQTLSLGPITSTRFIVVPSKSPGTLAFFSENLEVQGSSSEKQTIEAVVTRLHGCSGAVGCKYHTEKLTAVPGYDYVDTSGELEFSEGVTQQSIQLEVLKKSVHQATDSFLVILDEATGGAQFDPDSDGGEEADILTVTICPSGVLSTPSGKLLRWIDSAVNLDDVRLGTAIWRDSFASAIYCNGSAEEQQNAHFTDWVFHIISLPWKLVFTTVPPTSYCHGWVCFCFSLFWIGLVSAVIGDFAELFGTVLQIPDSVTAITFVALGTSMPDLFASHSAATQDPFADASICNVTGSNSVNVFLGLGLPWTVGALHWRFFAERDAKWEAAYPEIEQRVKDWSHNVVFAVPSGSLGFNVLIYSIFSIASLMLLGLRRKALGGELGGAFGPKLATAVTLVVMWLGYIALASWQAMRWNVATSHEVWSIMLSVFFVELVLVIGSAAMLIQHWRNSEEFDVIANADTAGGSPSLVAANHVGLGSTAQDPPMQNKVEPADAAAGPPLHAEPMHTIPWHGSWKPDQASGPPKKMENPKQLYPFQDDILPSEAVDGASTLPSQPPLTPPIQPSLMSLLTDRPLNTGAQDSLQPVMFGSRPGLSPLMHYPNAARDAFLSGCAYNGESAAPGTALVGGTFLATSVSRAHSPQQAAPGPGMPPVPRPVGRTLISL